MRASASFGAATPTELIRFALAWAPFEDPADEIFVTFGMSSSVFYERVLALLTTGHARLDVAESVALVEHCRDRLRLNALRASPSRSVA
ncbi:hypothetical protein GOPIP_084_00240 [Gordonia polyisoprenivorans NBRC 16320 = JCM 10675]|uniref:DUF3263 domain-containing protein n=1 Tax=Gordonia polyisoprenivorans TaxID=84595 RepID=A0A846WTF6_9ACTN|nr:hypothetical protein [Gordonia polyisoprenivorans]NKY04417.1 hypothetical protein [Gordonia polyisoprenivorans]OZC29454.1 hypothetical protein CJJ17_27190 [Gordonia polyisoprenivorans]WCB38919.1 hypothetical protein PHA63_07305 [Gordonia polyisoprenivorans]GAB25441.1 hypothetical protein GOPIP_084_00240 [Gordonia polyisoprenivorans NBRC 16320 = JCM 10675]